MQNNSSDLSKDNVFMEIIATEGTYNKALALIIAALSQEKLTGNHALLLKIKPAAEALKTVSDELLTHLEKTATLDLSKGSCEDANLLRKNRAELLDKFFKAYEAYAPLFKEYTQEMDKNPKEFTDVHHYMRQNNENKQGLLPHLVTPIQRGPRYLLLLKELAKNKEAPNHEYITEFVKSVEVRLAKANESVERKYQFGDYTRAIFSKVWNYRSVEQKPVVTPINEQQAETLPASSYQFGDYTKGAVKGVASLGRSLFGYFSGGNATTKDNEQEKQTPELKN
ncbi:RhoGEF domain-containing protein [Legionella septentrionalis]|uniref:RhoGEF domain-containing protein n=1 Tax=Legionella septentrionalis TaxID=2498109 RepID=UPI000F8C915B|nr:RhoGEF domain-containing protein [Legionella septentrionalis]RUR10604.1 hypothetical protein ELY14_04625 [Legionella septentrionalis]